MLKKFNEICKTNHNIFNKPYKIYINRITEETEFYVVTPTFYLQQ
jgi:hypothetical protein